MNKKDRAVLNLVNRAMGTLNEIMFCYSRGHPDMVVVNINSTIDDLRRIAKRLKLSDKIILIPDKEAPDER